MANITEARKKSWTTPVIRELRGAEAEEVRKLLIRQAKLRGDQVRPS